MSCFRPSVPVSHEVSSRALGSSRFRCRGPTTYRLVLPRCDCAVIVLQGLSYDSNLVLVLVAGLQQVLLGP